MVALVHDGNHRLGALLGPQHGPQLIERPEAQLVRVLEDALHARDALRAQPAQRARQDFGLHGDGGRVVVLVDAGDRGCALDEGVQRAAELVLARLYLLEQPLDPLALRRRELPLHHGEDRVQHDARLQPAHPHAVLARVVHERLGARAVHDLPHLVHHPRQPPLERLEVPQQHLIRRVVLQGQPQVVYDRRALQVEVRVHAVEALVGLGLGELLPRVGQGGERRRRDRPSPGRPIRAAVAPCDGAPLAEARAAAEACLPLLQ
mmetsp:Transcript_23997/g.75120  ORF Transcript_23997/g.75120 Transcript_23997/m.75120 type:complete len:263 (-) Transcript_23997:4888-5676(-)